MKIQKRILSGLLALILVLGMIPAPVYASEAEEAEILLPEETGAVEETLPAAETAETVLTEPVGTETAETEAAQTEPALTEPEETVPMETEAAETEPVLTEPEETVPAETGAEETIPEETVPEETAGETIPEEIRVEGMEESAALSDTMTQAQFDRLLTEAAKTGTLNLQDRVTLTKDVTIPENVRLELGDQGSITVPDGMTLTICGGGGVFGDLLVERGGRLELKNYLLWLYNGSAVDIQGTYVPNGWGFFYRVTHNGAFLGTVSGVDNRDMGVYVRVENDGYWEESLAVFQDPDYILTNLGIQGNVTLPRSITVGENRNICVEGDGNNSLTIARGVTLSTESQVTVYDRHSLIVDGTLEFNARSSGVYVYGDMIVNGTVINNWDIIVEGTLVNNGRIDLMASDSDDIYTLLLIQSGGRMENYGSVHCYGGGTVEVSGTWEYNEPIRHSLARPKNLAWHKMVRGSEGAVYDAKGHIYWQAVEPEDGEYVVQIYNADTGERVFRTNGSFGGFDTNDRSMPAFFEADLPSGNYYFTVTAVSNSEEYTDSAPVRSDVFAYTRPGSAIGNPRDVRWDGLDAVWTVPSDGNSLTNYEIQWFYAESADAQPVRRSSEFNLRGTRKSLPSWVMADCGAGYYSFRVRAIPSDITKKTIGAWVESERFYYDPDTFCYDETYLKELHSQNPPGMDSSIEFKYLQAPVVLQNDVALGKNVQLDIAGGGSITVPAGVTLTLNHPTSVYNGGRLIVEAGGKLVVNRDLWVGYDCDIQIDGEIEFAENVWAYFTYGQSFSMRGVPAENVLVEVIYDAGCTMVENLFTFFEESRWGWTILRVEGDMTLPRDVTSPVRSNIYIPGNSSLTVPAGVTLSIPRDARMNVDGGLYVGGTVQGLDTEINPEAVIHITENGYVSNSGRVIANPGTVVDVKGTWEGNAPENNGGFTMMDMAFGDFKAQVTAMKETGTLALDRSVVLEGSLTVPKHVYLALNGAVITVPKGKTLTLNGGLSLNDGGAVIVKEGGKLILNEQVWVNYNGKLINYGTVTFGKNAAGEKAVVHTYLESGNSQVTGVPHGNQILHLEVDNFEFPGWRDYKAVFENHDYAQCQLGIWGYEKAVLDEDLTVPANSMLIINPSWSDINNGTRNDWVEINGNVTVYGIMWINARYNGTPCNLELNGNVQVMAGGTLNVSGNVRNNGSVRIASGGYLNDYRQNFGAVWEGPMPQMDWSEKELRDRIAAGGSVTLNNSITLTKSLTIPQGTYLHIYGEGALTVPAGVTLTVDQNVSLWGGSLTVESGGVMKLNTYVDVYDGASVTVRGTVQYKDWFSVVRRNADGTWAESSITGIPAEHQSLSVHFTAGNREYWDTAADLVENNGYPVAFMIVRDGNVTLPRDMTIPESTLVHLDNGSAVLEIPEGVTLTNHGELYVWNGTVLRNYGSLRNHRGVYVYGSLYNYGDIRMDESRQEYESIFEIFPDGYLRNDGQASVNPGGHLLAVGTWEGNDPVDNGGNMIMGRYAVSSDGARLVAGQSLSLKIFDYAEYQNLADKQVTWSLPEEYAAFATLTAKGKLTAQKVTETVTIEAVGTVIATGETVSATLELIPAVTYVAVLDGESVINGKTVDVDIYGGEREFRLELYPLDLDTEELKDSQCTWTVSDKKDAYATYQVKNGILTVTPTGKSGTVTVKVACSLGAKKNVTFKLNFASYATEVEIFNTETTLLGGDKLELYARVLPLNATKTDVVWSLKDPADKAYVSLSKNVLKAKMVDDSREIVLVAASKDGKASREYTITLQPKNPDVLVLKHEGKSVTKGTIYADLNTTSSIQLEAYLFGAEEEAENVTWKSSSSKVAFVSGGTVHLLGAGSTTITAACGSRKATVTVKAARLASCVTVTGPVEVASGKTIQLKAAVADGTSQKVTWSILQGEEWGKISSAGKFTAGKDILSAQTVQIVATAADGSGVASEVFTVTVRPLASGVQVFTARDGVMLFSARSSGSWWNRSSTTFLWDMSTQGTTMELSAKVFPFYGEDSRLNAIQDVTWKSSNTKVAAIREEEDGSIWLDCLKSGSVTVTATAADGSGQKASFKLTVVKTVTDLYISDQTVPSSKTLNLAKLVTIAPGDATNKKLTWTITSGDSFATLSSSGSFKAKKVTAPVTVEVTVASQDGGASKAFTVTILP